MLVDLSHVSPKVMDDALRVSASPVIFSHSSARALCDVPRNVPDSVLAKLAANGGMVMVSFVTVFTTPEAARWETDLEAESERVAKLTPGDDEAAKSALGAWQKAHPQPPVTVAQVADHIDHVRKIAGIDHVGIGSDFDGISSAPQGLEDVSKYPNLIAELVRRGYTDDQVKKVAGLNLLRVLRSAEQVARRLQAERPPSNALIAELDAKR
jgi:membrane dipeptidase